MTWATNNNPFSASRMFERQWENQYLNSSQAEIERITRSLRRRLESDDGNESSQETQSKTPVRANRNYQTLDYPIMYTPRTENHPFNLKSFILSCCCMQ
ncbi:MAG: hypothetical protein ACH349_03490 [Candidatus Rhabdochlamydia sp.]|jgi:hypothetical protein